MVDHHYHISYTNGTHIWVLSPLLPSSPLSLYLQVSKTPLTPYTENWKTISLNEPGQGFFLLKWFSLLLLGADFSSFTSSWTKHAGLLRFCSEHSSNLTHFPWILWSRQSKFLPVLARHPSFGVTFRRALFGFIEVTRHRNRKAFVFSSTWFVLYRNSHLCLWQFPDRRWVTPSFLASAWNKLNASSFSAKAMEWNANDKWRRRCIFFPPFTLAHCSSPHLSPLLMNILLFLQHL